MRRIGYIFLFLCFSLFEIFAQTNPFVGDWYYSPKYPEAPLDYAAKRIFRIELLSSGEYSIRGKDVRSDNGETISYHGEYQYVKNESDSTSIVFCKIVKGTNTHCRYYRFTSDGELAILTWFKSFNSGYDWPDHKGYHEEWMYFSEEEDKHILHRVDDF